MQGDFDATLSFIVNKYFQKREKELKEKGEEVSKPPYWGGYRVIPDCFEFWQGQTTRIHDRLRDESSEYKWKSQKILFSLCSD